MSLYKRGKVWYMDLRIKGMRVNRSTGKKDKNEALKVEQIERIKLEGKCFERPLSSKVWHQMPLLSEAAERMYEDRWSYNQDGLHPYNRILFLVESFGDLPVDKITSSWVYNVKTSLAKQLKVATVNRYLAHLKTLLITARDEWGIIDKVPIIKLYRERNGRTRVITYEEEETLVNLLKTSNNREYDSDVGVLVEFLCDTGLRLSEALNLGPDNLSSNGRIHLHTTDTKSNRSRSVALTKRAKNIIGIRGKRPFSNLNKFQANRAFNWAKKEMGIKATDFCLHACRHTFASRLLEKGVDIFTVHILLGHTSMATTKRYSHLSKGLLDDAIKNLEKR